ncbi:MAG TPA: MgtC/SapB family protein [Steroidobacteraceae bacterium]|nr:MgtC/SapB family protein [Steroidobacteraceae bacterium]
MHILQFFSVEPHGQTALQLGELTLALVLSSLIGLEREFKMKSAGLRTHTIVGVAAALIMLVSKYGFVDVLAKDLVVVDPSRVAAQIVSGIGFIGGGLIFVQRDMVRGLTTAAIIWLTAAVGMACGAGLPVLALCVTAAHFLVIYAYTPVARRIVSGQVELEVRYVPGKGALEKILQMCAGREFFIQELALDPAASAAEQEVRAIHLQLRGRRGLDALVLAVGDVKGVVSVRMAPPAGRGEAA